MTKPFNENVAIAVAGNAVLVSGTNRQSSDQQTRPRETYGITALDIQTGRPFWRHSLPSGPVAWGMAVDRHGRVLVALRDGRVRCLGVDDRE